jgi:hypothetical protein
MNDTTSNETRPVVMASLTKSKSGSAALFTRRGMYHVFDASAPGMSSEKSLERAHYAADAFNNYEAVLKALKVIGLTSASRVWLYNNDPQALKQLDAALKAADPTYPQQVLRLVSTSGVVS